MYPEAYRNDIIKNMFVDSADDTYVAARWCYQVRLNTDFLWNAVHCLEKLMKAVLLFNGKSAKDHRHNLPNLYREVRDIAPDLLPDMLIKPNEIGDSECYWHLELSKNFIGRLYENGQAHNRYHVSGYGLHIFDICKLDRMVFAIRRLCCQLHSCPFLGVPATNRELLKKNPNHMSCWAGSRLKKLTDGKPGNSLASDQHAAELLRHAALNHNFMFAPVFARDFVHDETISAYMASQNPVLERRIVRPYEEGATGKKAREIACLAGWALDNIKLPPKFKKKFKDIRDTQGQKYGGNPQ
ncbi:MAG: hypothetical protein GDA39_00505 [Hyphomonadaceae bacterium]|nr:hypothetical protein [Hyphomonadaceae bacterium]